MFTSNNETYEIKLYKKVMNSAYQYEETPSAIFYGRPASNVEKKTYRIQKGVNSSTSGTTLFCSNLPINAEEGDKVEFMGQVWTIENVGFYMQENRLINAKIFSDEYLIAQCPKGLTIS